MSFFNNVADSVREVNRKYAKPEIETTLFVKICLVVLRVYLLSMVALMVYALVKDAVGGGNPSETAPTAAPTTTNTASQGNSVSSTTTTGGQL